MRIARTISIILFLAFFSLSVGGGLFWANMNFVQHVSGGVEFVMPWKAIQNFMMSGDSPYAESTRASIESLMYGHPAWSWQNPYFVTLPLTMLLFFLPLGWISDLVLARVIWLMVLEVGLAGMVFLSLRLARWKPHWFFLIFLLLFSFFWMPSISMLYTGTSVILQALVFFGALRAIELESDELAGALAALALLNIEATGLVFLTLIIWIFSTQRWRVLGGIAMTVAVLLGLSLLLSPSWIFPFLIVMLKNWQTTALPSTYRLLEGWLPGIGVKLSQILAVGALSIILIEWRAVRGQDVRWLFWTASLTAALTPLLGIPYAPGWLAFTLPGVLLVVSVMIQRWGVLGFASALLFVTGLFLGLWSAQLNGTTSVFILFTPLLLTLMLYWVRWWMVRPPRMWADEILLRG
ncbi:MAG: hypothetical protein NT121_02820 [Chloroflexi bacterium]|nr:hypothetical protein [Chloroflexota bacterium]